MSQAASGSTGFDRQFGFTLRFGTVASTVCVDRVLLYTGENEGVPQTLPRYTHENLSRLKSNLRRLIRKSAGDRPDKRAMIAGLGKRGAIWKLRN